MEGRAEDHAPLAYELTLRTGNAKARIAFSLYSSYYPDNRMTTLVFDHLSALADSTRARLLTALEAHELSVRELQAALQLPQSTISRHLRTLADHGWVSARPEGASHRYRFSAPAPGSSRHRLWALVREEVAASRTAKGDKDRIRAVLTERHARSREFFAGEAGRWDRLREELFGRRYELGVLLGLLDPEAVVGDLGCGTGALAAELAPFVARVIAVDESAPMLDAARARLANLPNVELREGELELLPVREDELSLAILAMVLPYVVDPGRILLEAGRAVQPGGRILVLDLQPHDRVEWEQTMGHLWRGIGRLQMIEWLNGAGFREARYVPLPPLPEARGPALFVATARKPE